FIAIQVENLMNFNSPDWLKEKLLSSGIIPTNDFLDFQNYILLETGYPFVFYDFEKIISNSTNNNKEFEINISKPKTSNEFLASNNINYQLTELTQLIYINDIPISIAGIIERKEFMCSKNTKSLLIEGSIFNAAKIRQQSRELGLRTEQSARHEKSLKNTYLIESLYRLISLLHINNPNLYCKLIKFMKRNEQALKSILLRYQTINETLGPILKANKTDFDYISKELINSYLDRLNFKFDYDKEKSIWQVEIPHLRSDDITREIDIIEEIGRLHGFNNFLTTLPKLKKIGSEDLSYKTRKKITSCLLNLGFNEFTHYSLVNETTFLPNQIKLINPLLSDCGNLRSTLIPSLIKTVENNLKQGNLIIEGFEYGHVFSIPKNGIFEEKEKIAGIFGGAKTKFSWSENSISVNWFQAKGKMEQLFDQLNLLVDWTSLNNPEAIFHPYKTSELYLTSGKKLGIFGQISPILSNQLNIDREIYIFELDLRTIQNQIEKNQLTIYKPYILYPKIIKDISFIIHQNVSFTELKKFLYANGTKFLVEINLVDEYKGKSIPFDHTSLCLQLVFQSNEKTLQTKDIEIIIKNFELLLIEKFDVLIRT
ncbi:MAG TPA: phenylalanine--tRNA ligase beta subunit-related protein, partial [Ignavibacteriaceae bacterium]|nr:phenylalanine--tRNA ligase beta subunit-related protein [Ignavibacteriaceae bacterium]